MWWERRLEHSEGLIEISEGWRVAGVDRLAGHVRRDGEDDIRISREEPGAEAEVEVLHLREEYGRLDVENEAVDLVSRVDKQDIILVRPLPFFRQNQKLT